MSELTKAIKQAILDSGESRYSIAKRSGITQATLSRLMSGERGPSVDTVETLAEALGLVITIKPRSKRQRSK